MATERAADWEAYLDGLGNAGRLRGGSAIGEGVCYRKAGAPVAVSAHLTGFIRIVAESLADAQACLPGNPAYEAGATVEIRLLPEDVPAA